MAVTRTDLSEALWFKSSYSNGDGGNCVEIAPHCPGTVPVRDSKAPGGAVLVVGREAWAPFVDALKAR
ncbi:DUF397 domain-containing protein [Streptomyces sp. NPDC047000]|uniref:DUF397 domain-containing protein n=1 Tax=Streptomyces sp. NPDC047000 TaxID=3155474 RepID=UPI003403E1F7